MKVSTAVSSYISNKRALGMRFKAEDAILKAFCKAIEDIPIANVPATAVRAFLDGHGPVTSTWAKKYHVLSGLYRFALARGWVGFSPMPRSIPKPSTPAFVPYIYSHTQLKRLLDLIPVACTVRSAIDADVFRALILLLYGAGLRLGEALALCMDDVNLQQACLEVCETKFFKHRLVPMGADLTKVVQEYFVKRNALHAACPDSVFLCARDGSMINQSAARNTFRRLRAAAAIHRDGGSRRQPRLHDLTARWQRYRSGHRAR